MIAAGLLFGNKHDGFNSVYFMRINSTPNKQIAAKTANLRFLYTNLMIVAQYFYFFVLFLQNVQSI